MKRMLCILLALTLLLCGCQSAALTPGESREPTEEMTDRMTEEATENMTEEEVDFTQMETVDVTLPLVEQPTEGGLTLGETGRVRVAYNGNTSYVRYITSVEQLPANEALKAYDAAYFENKALLIVAETVGSGSVRVDIESVENGVVTLSHEMSGDVGTADMATWLLWAEVEQGLDYSWSVANPALENNASTY